MKKGHKLLNHVPFAFGFRGSSRLSVGDGILSPTLSGSSLILAGNSLPKIRLVRSTQETKFLRPSNVDLP